MTRDEVYHAWADPQSPWARWVKPVLFAHLTGAQIADAEAVTFPPIETHDLSWAPKSDGGAVVVDLSGASSMTMGLSLARAGYRPIPLYNSVPSAMSGAGLGTPARVAVDMSPVIELLVRGAPELTGLRLPPDAPPAFLLDSRRRGANIASVGPGDFDNRSISLPTDFPSANFLLANKVRQVCVVQELADDPATDLSHTLRRWQEAGVQIHRWYPNLGAPEPITVAKPARFRHLWYGLLARMGLRRNPLGGYGGYLPIPSQGGSRFG